MANLLPPPAKENIRQMDTARFIMLGSFALIAAALIACVSILPSYILLKVQEAEESDAAAAQSSEVASVKTDLTKSQALVTQFTPLATSSPFLATFESILTNRSRGLQLKELSYTRATKGTNGEIILDGVSASRDDINAFRVALDADSRFSNVSVPVSALAGAQDGRFTITLNGAF